ncbi:ABC transporter ATP-binding protein/permease [Pannus brasiliensis]|uniref:ABC transporter ATP-binding protein/permease n=1 Tax=Pannus brasiliensis TaxID=1579216 RepID=UPI002FCDD527
MVSSQRYWLSEERWRAWGILALVILFIVIYNEASALLNRYQGEFTTALTDKKVEDFQRSLFQFGGMLLVFILFWFSANFIQRKLQLYWREWLTNDFLDRYFSDRAFYHINASKAIDNPDQRISEDIESFINNSLEYTLSFGSTILSGFLFIKILWTINHELVFLAIVTSIVQTFISFFIGRVLTPLNFKNLEYQADFRYSLVHVRNHSESIAFYEGEAEEEAMVRARFSRLLKVLHAKIPPNSLLGAINISLSFTVLILAYLILAPQYFAGQITIGDVTRSVPAFLTIVGAFSWFASSFEGLTLFAAVIKRLGTFADYLDRNQKSDPRESVVNTLVEPRFALSHLTLQTPDRGRTLVQDISIEIPDSEGILIMGASGSGKSSILRAVAGLWNAGEGYIYRPKTEEIFFIPQRPYMVLGSLRNQILYPRTEREVKDIDLQEILNKVNLADLAERVGGFDVELNWADVLSLGEQQRLSFARLFFSKAKYAVLDESTSALDVPNEKHLYQMLRDSDITYISVGHRPTLIPYHQAIVEILGKGKWRVLNDEESARVALG